jgi:multiple sugar transport system ATP-binding protein
LLGIRPEHIEDGALQPDAPPDRRIRTTCELTEPLGAEMLVHFTVSAPVIVTDTSGEADPTLGASPPGSDDGAARLVARVDPRSKITESSEIELAVDTSRLYFFDPETRETV